MAPSWKNSAVARCPAPGALPKLLKATCQAAPWAILVLVFEMYPPVAPMSCAIRRIESSEAT